MWTRVPVSADEGHELDDHDQGSGRADFSVWVHAPIP